MTFAEMLKILEENQVPSTNFDDSNTPDSNSDLSSDRTHLDKGRVSKISPSSDVSQTYERREKRRILPIRDILEKVHIGQDATVLIYDDLSTPFSSGWQVINKGQRFITLQKKPVGKDELSGTLVVPNHIYVNWQLSRLNKASRSTKYISPSERIDFDY